MEIQYLHCIQNVRTMGFNNLESELRIYLFECYVQMNMASIFNPNVTNITSCSGIIHPPNYMIDDDNDGKDFLVKLGSLTN